MNGTYIIPVIGQVYTNRNGGEYRCIDNVFCASDGVDPKDHIASFERVKDGWRLYAHGILEYEDGTIEWNYSTGGHFT